MTPPGPNPYPSPSPNGDGAGRFDRLTTPRLVLRRWQELDREPFAALNADPAVMRFFPEPLDRAASDALIDRIENHFDERGFGLWAVEARDPDGAHGFIGFTGLAPMPPGVPGAGGIEIGWRLAAHAWHRGYATEAARAVRDLAFGEIGLTQLWSMTAILNQPSQAVMRRLGMRRHAVFEHPHVPQHHVVRPHVVYRADRDASA